MTVLPAPSPEGAFSFPLFTFPVLKKEISRGKIRKTDFDSISGGYFHGSDCQRQHQDHRLGWLDRNGNGLVEE